MEAGYASAFCCRVPACRDSEWGDSVLCADNVVLRFAELLHFERLTSCRQPDYPPASRLETGAFGFSLFMAVQIRYLIPRFNGKTCAHNWTPLMHGVLPGASEVEMAAIGGQSSRAPAAYERIEPRGH